MLIPSSGIIMNLRSMLLSIRFFAEAFMKEKNDEPE